MDFETNCLINRTIFFLPERFIIWPFRFVIQEYSVFAPSPFVFGNVARKLHFMGVLQL